MPAYFCSQKKTPREWSQQFNGSPNKISSQTGQVLDNNCAKKIDSNMPAINIAKCTSGPSGPKYLYSEVWGRRGTEQASRVTNGQPTVVPITSSNKLAIVLRLLFAEEEFCVVYYKRGRGQDGGYIVVSVGGEAMKKKASTGKGKGEESSLCLVKLLFYRKLGLIDRRPHTARIWSETWPVWIRENEFSRSQRQNETFFFFTSPHCRRKRKENNERSAAYHLDIQRYRYR